MTSGKLPFGPSVAICQITPKPSGLRNTFTFLSAFPCTHILPPGLPDHRPGVSCPLCSVREKWTKTARLPVTRLCPMRGVNQSAGRVPELRPPHSLGLQRSRGMFVASIKRKVLFLIKYSLLHTSFTARLWSKTSFLDDFCKTQKLCSTILHDSMKRQNVEMFNKSGHQLSSRICSGAWPDFQDTFHRGQKVHRFFCQPGSPELTTHKYLLASWSQ